MNDSVNIKVLVRFTAKRRIYREQNGLRLTVV